MLTTRIVEMIGVTEAAALAAGRWMGKGDKHAADNAAVEGMRAAEGILTARGGMTSHAALVARGWGKCCVVGCSALHVDSHAKTVAVGGTVVSPGRQRSRLDEAMVTRAAGRRAASAEASAQPRTFSALGDSAAAFSDFRHTARRPRLTCPPLRSGPPVMVSGGSDGRVWIGRKKAHTPAEIVAKLRQAEVLVGPRKLLCVVDEPQRRCQ